MASAYVPNPRAELQSFHAITDPFPIWLNQNTTERSEAISPRVQIRDAYNKHLEQKGRAKETERSFAKLFSFYKPNIESKQRTIDGKLQWCYIGLELTK